MTPWKGTDAWISLRDRTWGLNPTKSLGYIGVFADGIVHRGLLWDGVPGFLGGDQGEPLSPTIINVVVDSVVRHWVLVIADQVGG